MIIHFGLAFLDFCHRVRLPDIDFSLSGADDLTICVGAHAFADTRWSDTSKGGDAKISKRKIRDENPSRW